MIVGQGHDKNVCAWMHLEEGQNRVWTDSGSVFLQGDSSAPSSLMAWGMPFFLARNASSLGNGR